MNIMTVPSRRILGIGNFTRLGAMGDDDSKVLIGASTDDLLLLGRIFTAYRRIVSQKMGGLISQFKPVLDMVDALRVGLAAAGLAPDQSTLDAAAARNDLLSPKSDTTQHLPSIDGFLDGIAKILVTRKPNWQVNYTDYTAGSQVMVVGRGGSEDPDPVSLDFKGTTFVECASFIYENRDILGRLKSGAGMSAAGGLLVVVIIAILALVALIFLLTAKAALSKSVETKRLEEALRKNVEQIAYNTSTVNRNTSEMAAIINTPESERTPADNARLNSLRIENDRLMAESRGLDAANVQIQKGLESARAAEDLMDRLASTLSSGFRYLVYGGVGIILVGIVLWIWRPFK